MKTAPNQCAKPGYCMVQFFHNLGHLLIEYRTKDFTPMDRIDLNHGMFQKEFGGHESKTEDIR